MKKLTTLLLTVMISVTFLLFSARTVHADTVISLNTYSASLSVDQTLQLTATVTVDDVVVEDAVVSWRSISDNASVDGNGLVTALIPGRATIRVEYEDAYAECELDISAPLPEGSYTVRTYYDGTETGNAYVNEYKLVPYMETLEQKQIDGVYYELSEVIVTATVDGESTDIATYNAGMSDGVYEIGSDTYLVYNMTTYAAAGDDVTAHIYYVKHGENDPYRISLTNAIAYDSDNEPVTQAVPGTTITVYFQAPDNVEDAVFFYWSITTGTGAVDTTIDHFTFTMPASPVTIRAEYKTTESPTFTCLSEIYLDGTKTSEAVSYFYEGYDGARVVSEPILSLNGSTTIRLIDAVIILSDETEGNTYTEDDFYESGHIDQFTFYDTWGYLNADELPADNVTIRWNYELVAGLGNLDEVYDQIETMVIDGNFEDTNAASFMALCWLSGFEDDIKEAIVTKVEEEIETAEGSEFEFYDYDVYLTVASMKDIEQNGMVIELDNKITYIIYLDDEIVELLEGKSLKIALYHNGEVEIIDCTLDGNALSFSTNKFSPYSVVSYEAIETEPAVPAEPSGSTGQGNGKNRYTVPKTGVE
ncbi:MAG: Ig-like domain-containing protein [Erysipelotrichaceae bacterium]|nr:Ig-like domain-containing protein [Erysipelotrichaceae bacterium]